MKAMPFRVLEAEGKDAAEWTRLVAALPVDQRDLHFLPQYGRIYARSHGQRPHLAVLGDERACVLQPFVVRSLGGLPFLAGHPEAAGFTDIANAYGYGGPALRADADGDAQAMLRNFEAAFLAYGREQGHASEFTLLHPLLGAAGRLRGIAGIEPTLQKEVVYVDLEGGRDAIRQGLRKGHRSSVTKALRLGADVARVAPTPAALVGFRRLYLGTMDRNRAAERWYFPDSYFADCFAELGDAGASLFEVRIDGQLAAASILLHAFDTAYYHFSGSDDRFADSGAGTLLVYEMACWAASQGCRRMHLGGGVSSAADDGLLRFKSGFSPRREPLHAYGRILDEGRYRRLCELKRRHELETLGGEIASGYFPLYRR